MQTSTIKASTNPPEEFYGQPDSAYLRIQYIKEQDGYRFEIRNELIQNAVSYEELPEGAKALAILIRGMAEMAIQQPGNMYHLGVQAANQDFLNSVDISPEQAKLLATDPQGNA